MNETTIHADSVAALTRLQATNPELKGELEKSWGFAVFPHIGRAGVVLGAAYGHGEVFEQGKSIGFATVSQMTLGVQVGGQTFSEVVIFPKKEALDEFRTGKVAFTGNASATIVKAAASGTTNFSGLTAHAYSRGGMLLELSLGGQKFMFVPPTRPPGEYKKEGGESGQPEEAAGDSGGQEAEASASGDDSAAANDGAGADDSDPEPDDSDPDPDDSDPDPEGDTDNENEPKQAADTESHQGEEGGESSGGHGAMQSLRHVGASLVSKVRKVGGHLPVLKKEAAINERLHADVVATLKRMKAKDESLAKKLDEAFAYAVYPAVGKASLVLGGAYGKGEVFRGGKLDGYTGVVQLTLGVQIGGQTYSELVLFQDEEALKRFKQGKLGFAANVSTVILKAGAAATNNYKQGMQIYVHSEGGLALEAVIGAQKLVYRRAGLTRGKPADRDPVLELGHSRPAVEHASHA